MARVIAIILLAVACTYAIFSTDVCNYDGYYQCTHPIPYNWQNPTSNAVQVGNGYNSVPVNFPFTVVLYGDVVANPWSFDPDLVVRNYNNGYHAITTLYSGSPDSSSNRWYEFFGTAPNRVGVFTYEHVNKGNTYVTVQAKFFENGNYEWHIKDANFPPNSYAGTGTEHFQGAQNNLVWFLANIPAGDYSNQAWGMYHGAPPTTDVCGDGVVSGNEQCDGGQCCSSTCTFLGSNTVCRAATTFCDIAESCSGSSSSCPADSFKSANTDCSEDIGVCDVNINKKCSGVSDQCGGLPAPQFNNAEVDWTGYTVLSFGSLNADTGSISGRAAVKNDFTAGAGFSVGADIVIVEGNIADSYKAITYALLAGHAVSWVSGSLQPSVEFGSIKNEFGYAGDGFTGSADLEDRFIANNTYDGHNLDGDFEDARSYYQAISDHFASEATNAYASLLWSGIVLNCTEASDRYVVEIDASLLAQATYYMVDGTTCSYPASWIVNIVGTDDVIFQGGDFPFIGERTIFNVIGQRNINLQTRLVGNLLAPASTLTQSGGVATGLVIVGDIALLSSITQPNCADLTPFTIVVPTNQASLAGASNIQVVGFSALISGDQIVANGATYTITARRQNEAGATSIDITPALSNNLASGSFVVATVSDPSAARTQDTIVNDKEKDSSAMSICVSFGLVALALMF